jgi:hypothetical protein
MISYYVFNIIDNQLFIPILDFKLIYFFKQLTIFPQKSLDFV